MKKTSKKILSLMLAVIMALPALYMMPYMAGAEVIDLSGMTIARYLVNDVNTDEIGDTTLNKVGSPSWDSNSFKTGLGSARLTDGNYFSIQIGSLLKSSGVASNGFSVSFYGKPDSSNSNQFGRFFEFNDKGNKGTIDYNSNRDSTFYASMWPYENKIEVDNYNYGSRAYISQSGVTNNYYNAWHHYVATFANGRVCVYVDGAVGYQTDTNQMNGDALNRICADNGYLLLGQAGWNDTGYTGWLRDFRVYNKALTQSEATQVKDQYDIDTELLTAISDYETKMGRMANGGVYYKNMTAAYNAYIAACKGYDAYTYGGDNSVDRQALTRALNLASENMTQWKKPTANEKTYYPKNGDNDNPHYANNFSVNLLSASLDSTNGETTVYDQTEDYMQVRLFYSKNVLLYDGETAPMFPVSFSYNLNNAPKKTGRYVHTVYPSTGNGSKGSTGDDSREFELWNGVKPNDSGDHSICWIGQDNKQMAYNWMYSQSSKVSAESTNAHNHWSSKHETGCNAGSTGQNWYANALRYKGGDPGVAFKEIYINWAFRTSGSEQQTTITNDSYKTAAATVPTYIYNYKGIKDKLDGKKGIVSAVSNYREGGLSTLLGYYDTLTRDWQTVKGDASTTNTAYSNIGSTSATADNSTRASNYESLRSKLTEYADTYNSNAAALGKTTSSFSTFQTKYNDVKAMFALVDDRGYANPSTDLGTLLTNLNNAYIGLKEVADFSGVDSAHSTALTNYTTALASGLYTTRSLNELNTYLNTAANFPYKSKTAAERADTAKDTYQTAITAEASAISGAQARILDLKYDFDSTDATYETSYNTLFGDATTVVGTLDTEGQAFTTTSIGAVQTALSNATYKPEGADRADAGQTHDGSAITAEMGTITSALSGLKALASFGTLLDAKQAWVDYITANAALYTTSSVTAFRNYINNSTGDFPYAQYNLAQRRNTAAETAQSAIDDEALAYAGINPLDYLVPLATKFDELDDAYDAAVAETRAALTSQYTTDSLTAARAYLDNATEFPYEKAADRADTGTDEDDEIELEIAKYENWKETFTGFDALADLTYFDAEYDKANTFLLNLNGKTAEYTADSLQDVVDAVTAAANASGANKSVQQIATATDRSNFGQLVQTDANNFADDIRDAMAALVKVDTSVAGDVEATDLSAYEAAVSILNNVDPDAYDVTAGDVTSIRNSANASFETNATTISYGGATINAIDGEVTQEQINGATQTILDALTVRTKQYTITKDETGSTDFTVSAKNGTSYGSGESADYGTTIVATTNDSSEVAWYLEIRTGSMWKKPAFQGYGKRLSTKVLGTTKIKAVKPSASERKVTIYRQYDDNALTDKSPIQAVEYVTAGESYTLPTAPAIAFYTFSGYYYKSNNEKINTAAIDDVSEDIEIYAKYEAAEGADCAINATGGSAAYSETVSYNDKVSLTGAADTYGWVEAIDATHYRPFKIGKDVEFFASESTELKAVNKATFDSYNFILPCINLRQSGVTTQTVDEKVKTIFNAQLVNNGMDIQEYGILIAAPLTKEGSTPIAIENMLPSMVVIENSGKHEGENAYQILRAKSTKLVGAGQFTIGVNSLPANYIYRGYAIYKDSDGNLQTVYSEAMR